jgi:hypothetical protein
MSLNKKKYYAMHYKNSDEGCPVALSGLFNYEEFEWSPYEPNPKNIVIKNEYKIGLTDLDMKLEDLDFDFFQVGAIYVSLDFLKICDGLGASYRAVPLEISFGGSTRKDEFFIFLPGESLPALDKNLSVYEVAKDIETGKVVNSPIYHGQVSIDTVDMFVVSDSVESDIFRCQETLELFCSERFKLKASSLKGISFVELDEQYRYDPWASFDDI